MRDSSGVLADSRRVIEERETPGDGHDLSGRDLRLLPAASETAVQAARMKPEAGVGLTVGASHDLTVQQPLK